MGGTTFTLSLSGGKPKRQKSYFELSASADNQIVSVLNTPLHDFLKTTATALHAVGVSSSLSGTRVERTCSTLPSCDEMLPAYSRRLGLFFSGTSQLGDVHRSQ